MTSILPVPLHRDVNRSVCPLSHSIGAPRCAMKCNAKTCLIRVENLGILLSRPEAEAFRITRPLTRDGTHGLIDTIRCLFITGREGENHWMQQQRRVYAAA